MKIIEAWHHDDLQAHRHAPLTIRYAQNDAIDSEIASFAPREAEEVLCSCTGMRRAPEARPTCSSRRQRRAGDSKFRYRPDSSNEDWIERYVEDRGSRRE